MDDDQFLYGLRETPTPEFSARLRDRLRKGDGRRFVLSRTLMKTAASIAVLAVVGSLVAGQFTRVTNMAPSAVEGNVPVATESGPPVAAPDRSETQAQATEGDKLATPPAIVMPPAVTAKPSAPAATPSSERANAPSPAPTAPSPAKALQFARPAAPTATPSPERAPAMAPLLKPIPQDELSAFRNESAPRPTPQAAAAPAQVASAPPAKFGAPKPYAGFAPGTVFHECDTCPEMVVVPAGSFQMRGDTQDDVRDVTFGRPFALGKTEVTFAEWDACVAEGACEVPLAARSRSSSTQKPSDQGWGRGTRPVIDVTWADAKQYTVWLSQKTGATYRLPTRAEWEYAARAGTTTRYSWGDEIGRNNANCFQCGSPWDGKQTAPVASFAPNPWGLHDMHGNVSEWVQDCVRETYSAAAKRVVWAREEVDCREGDRRTARSNGFQDGPNGNPPALSLFRLSFPPDYRHYDLGFRLARALD